MTFYGGVQGSKRNKWLDFDSDPDHDPSLMGIWAFQVLGI